MVRRWQVHPDMQIETQRYGLIPVVSRQLIDQAFLDGAAMVAAAGGGFTAFPHRHPTDLDHEMVTVSLMCEWRDRTDAKPQPEPAVAPQPEPEEEPQAVFPPADAEEVAATVDDGAEIVVEGDSVNPDGFDYTTLEDEDLESVPENVR